MALNGVVVERNPFWPQREGLPEERVQRYSAKQTDDEATKSGWDYDTHDRNPLRYEQVYGYRADQYSQLASKDDASDGE
tara:strand:- start:18155 stop:18391 length:237 start_codon:yes stop_codon:yes gene_type:complete